MTIVGIDDTDSRTEGMCTTYVGHLIAEELSNNHGANVERVMLVRLNPAAKHKTRGNASVAIHTDAEPERALEVATSLVSDLSADSDDMTNPGVVVSETDSPSDEIVEFTGKVINSLRSIEEAEKIIEDNGLLSYHQGNGRGRIGCVAAIGAWDYLDDWTYECIAYREDHNRGSPRDVDIDSVFEYADETYPVAWDTVDRVQESAVCIPNTPGPILYGIRGDNSTIVEKMARGINSLEPIESYQTFVTNQGTDAHINDAQSISELSDDTAYQVTGTVSEEPETKEGGHVFFKISDGSDEISVVAFEPTKHFRDIVRSLIEGDKVTVCGEVSDGTLKIEKLACRDLVRTEQTNPTCPDCGRSMSSAGANQGYRCRDCSNHRDEPATIEISRDIDEGWYEVPPCARRHIAKPLIRGGFDAPVHPFK